MRVAFYANLKDSDIFWEKDGEKFVFYDFISSEFLPDLNIGKLKDVVIKNSIGVDSSVRDGCNSGCI